jgi:hypothetical protein
MLRMSSWNSFVQVVDEWGTLLEWSFMDNESARKRICTRVIVPVADVTWDGLLPQERKTSRQDDCVVTGEGKIPIRHGLSHSPSRWLSSVMTLFHFLHVLKIWIWNYHIWRSPIIYHWDCFRCGSHHHSQLPRSTVWLWCVYAADISYPYYCLNYCDSWRLNTSGSGMWRNVFRLQVASQHLTWRVLVWKGTFQHPASNVLGLRSSLFWDVAQSMLVFS